MGDSNETIANIFKNDLDDKLGITKTQKELSKLVNMAKGSTYTAQAETFITTKVGDVKTKSAEYLKQLKDAGVPMSEAKERAMKYGRALLDNVMEEAKLKYPGYKEATLIELRKKSGLSGVIRDKPYKPKKEAKKSGAKKTVRKPRRKTK